MIPALGHTLLFLVMNGMVLMTAARVTHSFFTLRTSQDFVLGTFFLSIAEILLIGFFWGSLGRMRLLPIAGTVSFLFILSFFFRKKDKTPLKGNSGEFLKAVVRNRTLLFTASVLFGFLLIKVVYNLRYPPLAWDSLGYHLTFPVEWLKQGKIGFYQIVFSDPSPTYYPFMSGLYFFWLFLPYHNAFMADLGQLPFYLALLLAVYGIGRRLSLDREFSFYAACLFGLIPNVLKQVEISHVDLIVACYFISALYFLMLSRARWNLSHFLFASLSMGLLAGTKTHGLLWLSTLLPYWTWLLIRVFQKGRAEAALYGLGALSLMLLFGSPSYLRNFLLTGDMMYPITLKIGPYLAKGVIDYADFRRNAAGAFRWAEFYFHNGLGAQLLLLITPALPLAIPLEFWRKKPDPERVYLCTLPFVIFFLFLFVNPFPGNFRYITHAFALGCVIGMCVFGRFFPKKMIRAFVILCVIASVAELAGHWELFFSLLATGVVFGTGEWYRRRPWRWNVSWKAALFVVAFGVTTLAYGEVLYLKNEFDLYPRNQFSNYNKSLAEAWKWLNQQTPQSGAKIAYTGRCLVYPLYGTSLKNEVFYVTVNGAPTPLHLCGGDYRRGARYAIWERMLLEKKVDYVVVYDIVRRTDSPPFIPRRDGGVEEYPIGVFPVEEEWAERHPERLKPVFQNEEVHIYEMFDCGSHS